MIQAFHCIDGTHIPIYAPLNTFLCYKQFHLLIVQDVYDCEGSFMECKWPDSVQNPKLFAKSSISKRLRSTDLPRIFQTISNGELKIVNYPIRNPPYPLVSCCMRE